MTLNVLIATDRHLLCVADRRLTAGSTIVSSSSTKMTAFQCRDARGFITYSGIGLDHRSATPNDWLVEDQSLASGGVMSMFEKIAKLAERHVSDLPVNFPYKRHSYYICAHYHTQLPFRVPMIRCISNYEDLAGPDTADILPAFKITRPAITRYGGYMIVAGDGSGVKAASRDRLRREYKHPSLKRALAASEKLIRDASYGRGRRGTVGTSLNYGYVEDGGMLLAGMKVVGGSRESVLSNFIALGARFSDIRFAPGLPPDDFEASDAVPNKTRTREITCPSCGNPQMRTVKKCDICDFDM